MEIYPDWFHEIIDARASAHFAVRDGMLRDETGDDAGQLQTRSTFAYKWQKEETYQSDAMREHSRAWLVDRYATLLASKYFQSADVAPLLLDAGCGSGYSAELLFGAHLQRLRYVGTDISRAVDVAARKFSLSKLQGSFVQADLVRLPFKDASFDVIFSEGVLHHTASTKNALGALARKLKSGGIIAFYVYAKKAPAREFTDDYIREQLHGLSGDEAWARLLPLTRLGKVLGELNATVTVPEAVDLLGIPKGEISLQRLFYWHVCKMFYREDLSIEEMNHINFDWFVPTYAHRQTPTEVRAWCDEFGLRVEAMRVEEAGMTTIAVRS